jgi:hypothetical protein
MKKYVKMVMMVNEMMMALAQVVIAEMHHQIQTIDPEIRI